jgi:hypothetical protein
MAKSKLPLEERIFIPRKTPEVIILGDGEVLTGPFCVNCGNQLSIHRATDLACPVRRLHPLLPKGEREVCTCGSGRRTQHAVDCNLTLYSYNGTMTR